MLTIEIIEDILNRIPDQTIHLVGDLFLDRYLDFDQSLTEPSLETGLDAFQITKVRSYPGALGTIINNLNALGVGQIHPITIIGDDGEGYELLQALRRMGNVKLDDVISTDEIRTPTYTKPMRILADGTLQEWHRLDIKNRQPFSSKINAELATRLQAILEKENVRVLLVLDQVSELNCGVMNESITGHLQHLITKEMFVLADSRERIRDFVGMAIKPNLRELFLDEVFQDLAQLPEKLLNLQRQTTQPIFCTLGDAGLWVINTAQEKVHVPAYPVTGPIDIVGAGDSCSAGIACAKVCGYNDFIAAAFGNLIASITIQQIGTTGTSTPDQVRKRWREV